MRAAEITPEIVALLQSMDLFRGKASDELVEWLGPAPFDGAECAPREYPAGADILIEGTFGNSFFILLRGRAGVFLGPERQSLAILEPGSFFGEMTLISGLPRNATVATLEPSTVIEVPRRAFEMWMKHPGPFRNIMDQVYIERALVNHLRLVPGFAELPAPTRHQLAGRARLRIFSKDEVIVREGDEGDAFYLIREGYVRVVKQMASGEQRVVAYLKDGSYFGESALLRSERRSATIVAMGKTEVIRIAKSDFLELVRQNEQLAGEVRGRDEKLRSAGPAETATPLGFVGEVVERGLIKATSALVIHLDSCTRCGNCVKACAELHEGISRLTRHGMLFDAPAAESPKAPDRLLVTTSCMHCWDPECMIGCPTGAITRDVNGEVVIQDSCIGCGSCARRCPYGNISMAEVASSSELEKQRTGAPLIGGYLKFWRTPEDEPMMHEVAAGNQKAAVRRIAVKCDLCQEYNYNHGCVHNCPYNAIERMEPSRFLQNMRGA